MEALCHLLILNLTVNPQEPAGVRSRRAVWQVEIWAGGERGGSQGIIIIQPSAFVTLKPNCYPLLVTTLKCWPFKCFLIFIFFFFIWHGFTIGLFIAGFTSYWVCWSLFLLAPLNFLHPLKQFRRVQSDGRGWMETAWLLNKFPSVRSWAKNRVRKLSCSAGQLPAGACGWSVTLAMGRLGCQSSPLWAAARWWSGCGGVGQRTASPVPLPLESLPAFRYV